MKYYNLVKSVQTTLPSNVHLTMHQLKHVPARSPVVFKPEDFTKHAKGLRKFNESSVYARQQLVSTHVLVCHGVLSIHVSISSIHPLESFSLFILSPLQLRTARRLCSFHSVLYLSQSWFESIFTRGHVLL